MKWLFMVILSIGIFILLSGCVQTGEKQHAGPQENKTIENKSIENKTIELIIAGPCNSTDRIAVDNCLLDNGLCENISTLNISDSCYYNKMECENILNENMKNDCETKTALTKCEQESNTNLCKSLATNDPIYCGSNTVCLLNYAFEKGSQASCEKLNDYEKTACTAVASADYKKCYNEAYEPSQKECLKLYASITHSDGDICSNINTRSYREDCYKGVAEASGEYSNCLLIETYNTERDCLQNVAIENVNASICDKITLSYSSEQQKNDIAFCKMRVGGLNYKPQICQEINDASYKWGCFGDSIVDGKVKAEDCDQIDKDTYPDWSAECYKSAKK